MNENYLSLGWDVGGWRSKNNVVCPLLSNGNKISWIGDPVRFKPSAISCLANPSDLIPFLIKAQSSPDPLWNWLAKPAPNQQTILAIDAPLGFSVAYQELVKWPTGHAAAGPTSLPASNLVENPETGQLNPYVENSYGFREAERFIRHRLGKQTLSAAFDYLGNNASLAIQVSRCWVGMGYGLPPFTSTSGEAGTILEVYPGIFRRNRGKKRSEMDERLLNWLSRGREEWRRCADPGEALRKKIESGFGYYLDSRAKTKDKTDEADAVICALLGAGWFLDELGLEKDWDQCVGGEIEEKVRKEGWIFFPKGII